MSELVKTIRINELPEANTINPDDVFLIEDEAVTRKITGADLLAYIKNYTDVNGGYLKASTVGVANGVAPLNDNKKIANTYLNFGTATGTIFDGGKGQVLQEDLDTHVADTSIHTTSTEKSNINNHIANSSIHITNTEKSDMNSHITNSSIHVTSTEKNNFHSHSNKSVLDTITQEKIDAWDAGAGSTGGATSLADLGVTATAAEVNVLDGITATTTELNYVDGVTSNIQTQLNTLTTSVNGKADASHGTHVSYSTTAPVMDGTASVGNATTVARSDHKHPSDTSKADVNHTHSDYAPASHGHSAGNITAGTLGGQIITPAGTDYDTNRVRNMVLVSADPQAGTASAYVNGTIICVYE